MNKNNYKSKNKNDQLLAKNFDTKIGTIEKTHKVDLGVDPDTKLGNYLKDKGYPSLSEMLMK